jgi:uncharacterized protein
MTDQTADAVTVPAEAPPRFRPVGEKERLLSMDALRGFALLGIFMVNMLLFAMPFVVMMGDTSVLEAPMGDRVAWAFVHVFCMFKFISTFSLLFGAGMMMQLTRAEAAGRAFVPLYVRRLFVLALFGLVHALLLWYGDILFIYATFGVLLLAVRRCSARTIIKIAIGVFIFSVVLGTGCGMLQLWGKHMQQLEQEQQAAAVEQVDETEPAEGEGAVDDDVAIAEGGGDDETADEEAPLRGWAAITAAQWQPMAEPWVEGEILAYREGPFLDAFVYRATSWAFAVIASVFTYGWHVLSLFLLGAALMKMRFFRPEMHALQGRLAILGFVIGLPLSVLHAALTWSAGFEQNATVILAGPVLQIGAVAMCLGYVGSICWLASTGILTLPLKLLGKAGRMALTVYIGETVIATAVMYWWGMGRFETFGRLELIGLVLLIYLGLVVFAVLWMRVFRIGPLEWLWRTLTYLRPQPLLRDRPAASS